MRINSVKLSHFRVYRDTTVIPIAEVITGIVCVALFMINTPDLRVE